MLSEKDLNKMMTLPDYQGFGYLGHPSRDSALDEIVLHCLNEQGLSFATAYMFLNSRIARFMADKIESEPKQAKKICQDYLGRYLPTLLREG